MQERLKVREGQRVTARESRKLLLCEREWGGALQQSIPPVKGNKSPAGNGFTKWLEYPFKCYYRKITTNTFLDLMSVRVRLLKQPSEKYMNSET